MVRPSPRPETSQKYFPAQTLQLRGFLSRSEHPYRYVDLDTDQKSQELLDRFDVREELLELPAAPCLPCIPCHARRIRNEVL